MPKISLTIYQKMLLAPIVAIFLAIVFFVYVYNQQQKSSDSIGSLKNDHIPVLKLSTENIFLFDALVDGMKDAVSAGELEWIDSTKLHKSKLDQNLDILSAYPLLIDQPKLQKLRQSIDNYYLSARELSSRLIQYPDGFSQRDKLISDVERYYETSTTDLKSLEAQLDYNSSLVFAELVQRHKWLLLIAIIFASIIIFSIILVTTLLSSSTKRRLTQINLAMKRLALDDTDFSKRIIDQGSDELSELVQWFNQLSDKMECSYQKIEELSVTDKLTQLHNRTKIDDLFSQEIERANRYQSSFAVILLDLDHFKAVNDSHGHQVGDIVLKQLAELLDVNIRKTDYVGRWGGEEFVIIAPETDINQALQSAEKIRHQIAEFEFDVVGHKTASFGVTSFIEQDTQESLIQRADNALYRAKAAGRNCVVADPM